MITKEIIHLYFEEKLSIRQVAKKLSLQQTKVSKILHDSGRGVRSNEEAMALRSSDEFREKLRQSQTGDRNHRAKLTEQKVLAIRQEYDLLQGTFSKTQSQYILAEQYGVKRPTISDIVNNRTWKHI